MWPTGPAAIRRQHMGSRGPLCIQVPGRVVIGPSIAPRLPSQHWGQCRHHQGYLRASNDWRCSGACSRDLHSMILREKPRLQNQTGDIMVIAYGEHHFERHPDGTARAVEERSFREFPQPHPGSHSRLERTFQIDAALTTKRDQKWIEEAIASGPETPLTKKEIDAIRDRVLRGKK